MRITMCRMWLTNLLLFLLLMALTVGHAHGQAAYNVDRDQKLFTAQGQTYTINNRIGALNLMFEYNVSGAPASLVMTITGCMRGGTCDTLDTYTGTASKNRPVTGLYDQYIITVTTLTGGTNPTIQMNTFFTANSSPASAQGGLATQVQGTAAVGAAAVGSPVEVAGADNGALIRALATNTSGVLANIVTTAGADALANNPSGQMVTPLGSAPLEVDDYIFNGSSWDRQRSASSANYIAATTLTARNDIGAPVTEKTGRWSVTSNPAGGTVASASIALEAGVKHVVDTVCFSAGSTAAPAATSLQVNIRDGATGAGTVIGVFEVDVPAAAGQNVAPTCVSNLNLVGTAGTAMTAEFNSGLASLKESIFITGHNVN